MHDNPDGKSGDGNRSEPTIAQRLQTMRIIRSAGIALISGFLLMVGYAVYQNSQTIAVQGTVVSSSSHIEGNQKQGTTYLTTYSHSFRYTDENGEEHIADAVGSPRDSRYQTGDVVSIGYYEEDRNKVRIHSWFGQWRIQLVLVFLGAGMIWFSVWENRRIRSGEYPE